MAPFPAVMVRGADSVTDGVIRVRVGVGEEWLEGKIVAAVDLIGSNPSKCKRQTRFRGKVKYLILNCYFSKRYLLFN